MSSTTTPRVTTWTNPWGKVFHYCTDCKGTADDGAKLCPTHAAAPEMRAMLAESLRKPNHGGPDRPCHRKTVLDREGCDCWVSDARALLARIDGAAGEPAS